MCGLDVDFSMVAPDTQPDSQPAALRKWEFARARIRRDKKVHKLGVAEDDFHIYGPSSNIPLDRIIIIVDVLYEGVSE